MARTLDLETLEFIWTLLTLGALWESRVPFQATCLFTRHLKVPRDTSPPTRDNNSSSASLMPAALSRLTQSFYVTSDPAANGSV